MEIPHKLHLFKNITLQLCNKQSKKHITKTMLTDSIPIYCPMSHKLWYTPLGI